MVTLTCEATRQDGVTLVTGSVSNPDGPRRVRLEHRLEGPLWPPREGGLPAVGWDEDGLTCVLDAEASRAIGYATPADPADPPMVVADAQPVDPDEESGFEPRVTVPEVEDSADGVVRALGSPRPPRDAVPTPDQSEGSGDVAAHEPDRSGEQVAADGEREPAVEDVRAWLDAVAARLDTAEHLDESAELAVAGETIATVGGLPGVRDLDERLEADEAALRRIADRAEALAERAAAADVPVETIERLA